MASSSVTVELGSIPGAVPTENQTTSHATTTTHPQPTLLQPSTTATTTAMTTPASQAQRPPPTPPILQDAEVRRRLVSWRGTSEQFGKFMQRWSPSYVLENKGAVARDHLANERTFLSYVRTSLSLLTVGVAVAQLYRLTSRTPTTSPGERTSEQVAAKAIGCLFIALAGLFILFGGVRYFYGQALMVRGLFPASRATVVLGSGMLLMITVAVFIASVIYV